MVCETHWAEGRLEQRPRTGLPTHTQSSRRHCRNFKAKFFLTLPMILLLVLWLCCVHFTNQETCSSPGDLPAPQMFLDKASSSQGDTVLMKCKIPALPPFTRVIFCKDGKEIAIQPMQQSKFAYDLHYKVSTSSSGNFSCLYEHKDNLNHQTLSLLSTAQHLSVTDKAPNSYITISGVQPLFNGLSSKSVLGITIPSTLGLVVLCSLLVTRGFGY